MSSQLPNPYAAPRTQPTATASLRDSGELATLSQRFAGAFIDGIILFPVMFAVGLVLGIALVAFEIEPDSRAFNLIATIVATVVGAVIFVAVNGYLLATRGQTVGKFFVKTRIVSDDGTPVPLGLLVLKRYLPIWVVSQIAYVGGLVALINVLMIFRANRKCLHDDIAGTKVIQL